MLYTIPRNTAGFSLLEIAIVLTISGFIFGMSLSLYRPLQAAQANAMTKQKVERVMNAISTYVLQKNALPCPGRPDAVAPDTPGHAPDSCATEDTPAVWGVVPYITLGLTQPDVIDGSGHYMTYVVPTVLTKSVGNSATDGQMTGLFKGNVASNFCGNITLSDEKMLVIKRPDQDMAEPNIAVAIIAYGHDGYGAYNMSLPDVKSRRCPLGASACRLPVETCNRKPGALDGLLGRASHERDNAVDRASCADNNAISVSGYSNQVGTNHFDDQILYATGSGLINRLGMAGCSQ